MQCCYSKANSVVHEIHGSIEDIPMLIDTKVKPDGSIPTTTIDLSSAISK